MDDVDENGNRNVSAKEVDEADDSTAMEISSLANMDAMAYLASVKAEASALPDIFVSATSASGVKSPGDHDDDNTMSMQEEPIDGSAAARDYLLSKRLDIIPPPTIHHTMCHQNRSKRQHWINTTIDNFSNLRTYLHNCHKVLKKCERTIVPKGKDYDAWLTFCLGDEMIKYMDVDDDMDDDTNDVKQGQDTNQDQEGEKDEVNVSMKRTHHDIRQLYQIPRSGNEPTTKLMSQFDQIIIRRMLQHFVTFMKVYFIGDGDETSTDDASGRIWKWIYALLSRLEKPLHRDEASGLMELLRSLCRIRGTIKLDDVDYDANEGLSSMGRSHATVKMLNVLIVIIGVYFEQCMDVDRLMTSSTSSLACDE